MSDTRRLVWSSRSAAACLCLLATACIPSLEGNEPREANDKVPAGYAGAAGASAAQATFQQFFGSPYLSALIDEALVNNRELNVQLQEIVIAKAEITARRGEYLPKVSAGAGAGVEKVGDLTSQGVSDDLHGVPKNLGNFTFGLSGTWEIDVWKKLRNATKAAQMRYLASIEAKNFFVTQLVAEIARSYYELIALDNALEIIHRNLDIQTDALELVKLQKQAARVTELAVQRFEAEVLKNRSRLYDVEQQRVQAENRINFLVGRYPQTVRRDPEEFKKPLPDSVGAGLPSQLLDNRPDLRRAALELEAAKLDVKAAKASFYPSLTIDAGVGYRSFNAAHLVDTPGSLFYGVAGGLTAPLLNRNAITAQYRAANAMQLQAVFEYEKTLLQAFTDVANQLAMIDNLHKSYELKQQQVDALTRSVEISNVLFQSARADYVEVMMTRRDALESELQLLETRKLQLMSLVNIYQALGGGWRTGK